MEKPIRVLANRARKWRAKMARAARERAAPAPPRAAAGAGVPEIRVMLLGTADLSHVTGAADPNHITKGG